MYTKNGFTPFCIPFVYLFGQILLSDWSTDVYMYTGGYRLYASVCHYVVSVCMYIVVLPFVYRFPITAFRCLEGLLSFVANIIQIEKEP